MQVWLTACGKTASIGSGKPLSPSVQTNKTSLTPRMRSSVSTLVQKRPPSVFSIQRPRQSRSPSSVTRRRRRPSYERPADRGSRPGARPDRRSRTAPRAAGPARAARRPGSGGHLDRPPFVGPAAMRVGWLLLGLSVQASGVDGWGLPAEAAVRPLVVVGLSPVIYDRLRLEHRVERLDGEHLVADARAERLDERVLPG